MDVPTEIAGGGSPKGEDSHGVGLVGDTFAAEWLPVSLEMEEQIVALGIAGKWVLHKTVPEWSGVAL